MYLLLCIIAGVLIVAYPVGLFLISKQQDRDISYLNKTLPLKEESSEDEPESAEHDEYLRTHCTCMNSDHDVPGGACTC